MLWLLLAPLCCGQLMVARVGGAQTVCKLLVHIPLARLLAGRVLELVVQ